MTDRQRIIDRLVRNGHTPEDAALLMDAAERNPRSLPVAVSVARLQLAVRDALEPLATAASRVISRVAGRKNRGA